ncbi:hypothetical protein A2W67_00765 [Candidatus Nomurabacteria bacterium RIFCSPLOWO2_02_40_28]|uniref:S-layer domain protein n=2 Tax=Candidatus Nomuraibacteriota TaxID=1752729 RepID=A0A837HUB8_9BACT|nr:MAG: S-layer domain protein [Candidatus Nomurabacteria bacterium GW2011_GWD2_39_12]KKR20749.1 MAG: S-layer domain protein [Candidatus Nomurabacteria bacterium GW2011_GWC2_39_41]KKR36856.1 MAG: S-layer domain protein [Candidatus Nomurabacteria bacterium GW2011_GWE2_40_10]KKR38570.1 MAG: S-layer domain protein [Candidatus Nomurabacteria bacterium GW2011_GWB1_40_11]KKR40295.1 MAG: S-layer domain protein [Parcubacteria group bacterium GW2011_GWC1_40_11]KKR59596.1 MAG: S-layer domain protein [Ca
MPWIAFAVLFLLALFFIKNKSSLLNSVKNESTTGLSYGDAILEDLVNKDTDLDGVYDWEESLWGTDPTKKDTDDDGVLDNLEIKDLSAQGGLVPGGQQVELGNEKLTETDKFSREFFSIVATLNQNGLVDLATVDKLGSSLADRIKNTLQRKMFSISDIKIASSDTLQAVKNYDNALTSLYKKYPTGKTVMEVLQKFMVDENNVDVNVLSELDPIIIRIQKIITGLLEISVPKSLASIHLELVNILQKLSENTSDIKLYESDVIVALSAIGQYEANITALETTSNKLGTIIEQKLK